MSSLFLFPLGNRAGFAPLRGLPYFENTSPELLLIDTFGSERPDPSPLDSTDAVNEVLSGKVN